MNGLPLYPTTETGVRLRLGERAEFDAMAWPLFALLALLGCLSLSPAVGEMGSFTRELLDFQNALATLPDARRLLQQLTDGSIETDVLRGIREAWEGFKDLDELYTLDYHQRRLQIQRTLLQALPLYLTGIALYWGYPFSRQASIQISQSLSSLQKLLAQPNPFGPLWHRIQRMLPRFKPGDRHVISQRELCPTLSSPEMLAALARMAQVVVAAVIFVHSLLSAQECWSNVIKCLSRLPSQAVLIAGRSYLTTGMHYLEFLLQAYQQHKCALEIFSEYLQQQTATLDVAALSMLQRVRVQLRLTGPTNDLGLGKIGSYLKGVLGEWEVANAIHEIEQTRTHAINADTEYLQIFSREFGERLVVGRNADGTFQSYWSLLPGERVKFEAWVYSRSCEIQQWARTWQGLSEALRLPFQPGYSWRTRPIVDPILPSADDFEFGKGLLMIAQQCRALHAIKGGVSPCPAVVQVNVVHEFLWLVGRHLEGWKARWDASGPSAPPGELLEGLLIQDDKSPSPLILYRQREEQYQAWVFEFEVFTRKYFVQLDPLLRLRYTERS